MAPGTAAAAPIGPGRGASTRPAGDIQVQVAGWPGPAGAGGHSGPPGGSLALRLIAARAWLCLTLSSARGIGSACLSWLVAIGRTQAGTGSMPVQAPSRCHWPQAGRGPATECPAIMIFRRATLRVSQRLSLEPEGAQPECTLSVCQCTSGKTRPGGPRFRHWHRALDGRALVPGAVTGSPAAPAASRLSG